MNSLFEQFVAIRLQQSLTRIDRGLRLNRQASHPLFKGAPGTIRPDLVVELSDMPALVADTKYKRKAGTDGDSGDYYQMITYCTVLGFNHGVLMYPRHLADIDTSLSVIGSDITIHETSIDLRNSRDWIQQEFQRLAWKLIRLGQQSHKVRSTA